MQKCVCLCVCGRQRVCQHERGQECERMNVEESEFRWTGRGNVIDRVVGQQARREMAAMKGQLATSSFYHHLHFLLFT